MKQEQIYIDYHKCVGCGTCEMVCSLAHEGICASDLSRIRVVRFDKIGRHVPISCASCDDSPCVSVCPTGAILPAAANGTPIIQDSKCIGCRQCVQACPFGHMNYNPLHGVAFKCDLCNGDPQCVKFCWTKALEYTAADKAVGSKRQSAAQKILGEN